MPDKPQLPPEQEAAVRRLLADARVTEPMPDDVAERLDGVLADLASSPAEGPAAVAELEARRRRRRAGSLVLAAAAVVIAGVGVGQLLQGTSGDDQGASVPATSEEEPGRGAAERGDDSALDRQYTAEKDAAEAAPQNGLRAAPSLPVAVVSRQNFAADVQRIRTALPRPIPVDGDFVRLRVARAAAVELAAPQQWSCSGSGWGTGALLPVEFDGQPAVLAYRPATKDSQVVDVLQCGSGQRLHTTTLSIGE